MNDHLEKKKAISESYLESLAPMLPALTSDTRVRVRYAETDQMGVVYHANYLVWFEVGRAEFIRSAGLDYKSMEAEGLGIAVVEVSIRYKAPAHYDDELIIRTSLTRSRGSMVHFSYAIYRASRSGADGNGAGEGAQGLLLAEGTTTHIVVNRAMKRAAMPERFAQAFRECSDGKL